MREIAIEKIMAKNQTVLTQGDYFHNGKRVLEDVTGWHKMLRGSLRITDTITNRVLDLVDEKMLLEDPLERINSKSLCNELMRISDDTRAGATSHRPLSESIMQALLEVDEEAPWKAEEAPWKAPETNSRKRSSASQSSIATQGGKSRKSKLLNLPLMKTTHRSEYLKSALKSTGTTRQRDSAISFTHPIHRTQRKADMQDVWQAREEIRRREKGNILKRTRKDKLLTKYFSDGKRDVVSSVL
jgi:hypothetical protein